MNALDNLQRVIDLATCSPWFARASVMNDLRVASVAVAEAALALNNDDPVDAFARIDTARAFLKLAVDQVADECGRRGYNVGGHNGKGEKD